MTTVIDGSTGCNKVQDGSIVQADLAANVVGNGPCFSAYANAGTSIPNGSAYTKINFQVESYDIGGGYDHTTGRFQPSVAGYYLIIGGVSCSTAATAGYFHIGIKKNGGAPSNLSSVSTQPGSYIQQVSGLVYLNGTTDYVEIGAQHAAGTAQTTGVGISVNFQGVLVRAA